MRNIFLNPKLNVSYKLENTVPPDTLRETAVLVPREPDQVRSAHDVVFRHKAPISGIQRVVTVIPHHPVVILTECVSGGFLPVYDEFPVFLLQSIIFI